MDDIESAITKMFQWKDDQWFVHEPTDKWWWK
jgi:hypothetical protein